MQSSPTTFARTLAFRAAGAIVVSNLFCLPFEGIRPSMLLVLDGAILALLAAFLAVVADREARRAAEAQSEGRRVLADHIRFAQELAASIARHPEDGGDPQLIRVEIVRLFFAHADRLDVTQNEMSELLRDTDPIVIADVVSSLANNRSPLLDESRVPWAAQVKDLARRHSSLCSRPIERLAWNRSLPRERAVPVA